MKRYTMNRHAIVVSKHESIRHQLHDERKSEEQKLNRLRTLLASKIQAALSARLETQAA
jgi:hypothetical protein